MENNLSNLETPTEETPRVKEMYHNPRLDAEISLGSFAPQDVTIVTTTQKFNVHKVVLSAQSKYFSRLFASICVETGTAVIDLTEDDPELVRIMLERMYSLLPDDNGVVLPTGLWVSPDLKTPLRNGLNLLYLADEKMVPELTRHALKRLECAAQITTAAYLAETCMEVFNTTEERLCDKDLRDMFQAALIERLKDGKADMDDPGYIVMLQETGLGAPVAQYYRETAAMPSPRRVYIVAKCTKDHCRGAREPWSVRCPKSIWAADMHCLYCGKQGITTKIEEDPKWNHEKMILDCCTQLEYRSECEQYNCHCVVCGKNPLGDGWATEW